MNKIKSLLFVPVTEKFLAKVPTMEANAIIFDLEDSISPEKKEEARALLKDFLSSSTKKDKVKWFVRINKDLARQELELFNNTIIDGFMLPKFENINNLQGIKNILKDKIVIALIETNFGIINIHDIAASELVSALAFGAEDYTASMNIKNSFEYLMFPRSKMITYAKAYRKPVYDTPCFNVKDTDIITKEVNISAECGFDGKLAINPVQVGIINSIFNNYDIDYIKYVVSEFEKSDSGVLVLGDNIYEKMHIARFKRILNNI